MLLLQPGAFPHLPLLEDSTAWEGFLQGGELMITLGGISLVRFQCVCAVPELQEVPLTSHTSS